MRTFTDVHWCAHTQKHTYAQIHKNTLMRKNTLTLTDQHLQDTQLAAHCVGQIEHIHKQIHRHTHEHIHKLPCTLAYKHEQM